MCVGCATIIGITCIAALYLSQAGVTKQVCTCRFSNTIAQVISTCLEQQACRGTIQQLTTDGLLIEPVTGHPHW
jgi:hypothetical protein